MNTPDHVTAAQTVASPPSVQGLDLFEVYEANGALLIVTSDLTSVKVEPTDAVFRRSWATASEASLVQTGGPR